MVLVFVIVILDFLDWIFEVLFQLLHPLGDDPKHGVGFNKENAIINFFIGVD
jgi:hypothetical protein